MDDHADLVGVHPDAHHAQRHGNTDHTSTFITAADVAFGTPGTIAPDDTADAGVATSYARSDHRHALTAAVPGSSAPGDVAAEGVAALFARSDHVHDRITEGAAWSTYTPSWGSSGATVPPTIGNGTLLGRYKEIGKTVFVNIALTFGTSTSAGNGAAFYFGLPTPTAPLGASVGTALAQNTGLAGYMGVAGITAANVILVFMYAGGAGGVVAFCTALVPFTWGTGDTLVMSVTYEIP